MLEATHRSKQCCGLGVHTVSSAWCKCTRDGSTPVVASSTAHMHGQAMYTNFLIIFIWFGNTFSCILQYSIQAQNFGFSQWVDPPAIDPYQQYIDYLEDVIIYNLNRELSEALASPDPSSSAGEDRCCKCSTCTCECHRKDWSPLPSPPPPPPGYYMPSQHSDGSMLSGLFSYN
jgi:hypothetical protein